MSALCELVMTTSRPHASVSSGTAARLEIASTTTSASEPEIRSAIDCTSETTPYEVTECVRKTILAPSISSSCAPTSSGLGDSPQPYRRCVSLQPYTSACMPTNSPKIAYD